MKRKFYITAIFLLYVSFSIAQEKEPCTDPLDPDCDNEYIPIDGGALALLAAGAALGYKALKKKKEEDSEAL